MGMGQGWWWTTWGWGVDGLAENVDLLGMVGPYGDGTGVLLG